MTRDEISAAVAEIISEVVPDEDCSAIEPEVALRDQLSLDSMDFLDIVMELRKRYGVEVPEQDYPRLATMRGCVDYLAPRLADR